MTQPDPIDDIQLDRLLGVHRAPPLSADFAQRVAAEAVREDRAPSLPPFPSPAHRARRPWTRRGLIVGVVAINLIVASAIAATFSGHFPVLQHVATSVARVLHIRHPHAAPHPIPVAHALLPHREAPIVAPPPVPPEALTPAQTFAERHPLMAMRREGLLPPRPLIQQRRAILFAERHPAAARMLAHRARLRALRDADAVRPAPLREERPTLDKVAAARNAAADTPRAAEQSGPRVRLDDREAFERERRELEQRANTEWPAKPADVREKPAEPQAKPAAAEKKPEHAGAAHPKWHERVKARHQAHPGRRRPL